MGARRKLQLQQSWCHFITMMLPKHSGRYHTKLSGKAVFDCRHGKRRTQLSSFSKLVSKFKGFWDICQLCDIFYSPNCPNYKSFSFFSNPFLRNSTSSLQNEIIPQCFVQSCLTQTTQNTQLHARALNAYCETKKKEKKPTRTKKNTAVDRYNTVVLLFQICLSIKKGKKLHLRPRMHHLGQRKPPGPSTKYCLVYMQLFQQSRPMHHGHNMTIHVTIPSLPSQIYISFWLLLLMIF